MNTHSVIDEPMERQGLPGDPVLSDNRASGRLGKAIAEATRTLDAHHPLSLTVGTQYPLAKMIVEGVVAHAASIDPKMTVTELHNLLTTGRRR